MSGFDPNSKMDQLYMMSSTDSEASYANSGYGGSQYSYAGSGSIESCDSLLSTSTTYGSYYQSWSGKDTCGYEADTESLASTK